MARRINRREAVRLFGSGAVQDIERGKTKSVVSPKGRLAFHDGHFHVADSKQLRREAKNR